MHQHLLHGEHMSSQHKNFDDVIDRAYKKIRELKQQLAARQAEEAVAIVGYGCRFPGGVSDGPGYWRALNAGHDMFSLVDESRWDLDRHYDPAGKTPGRMYTLAAGLTENVDHFDASFFGIPAIEAESLDPQQRMLLEVSWHAFEDAGIDPRLLRGSNTGVFVGLTSDDYLRLHTRSGHPVSAYSGLGSAKSLAAGRLAYIYDFHGPTLQLDTTCSSGLVALHLAARELRDRHCDLALVGGANAIVSPDTTIGFCEMNALSRKGKLRAFDHAADGYVRGEGCGILILKRYSDAIKDKDRIHAVVLGSAMNHDGRTNGLTAPNPLAQEQVLRRALSAAGRQACEVQYVEAHGTGTPLGDLIEANALGAVYGERQDTLRIGSVKANIGHLEAASGIASVIKVLLGMKHGKVPGQVNFEEPNKRIDWQALHLDVSASDWNWEERVEGRCAGVSSFGMSGTNVHVILSEVPEKSDGCLQQDSPSLWPDLLLLSARTPSALKRRIEQWRDRISCAENHELNVLTRGSRTSFTHFEEYRLALRGDRHALLQGLMKRSNQDPVRTMDVPRNGIVFAFSGEETCYEGMARTLYREQPVFAQAFDECAKAFAVESGDDLVAWCNATNGNPIMPMCDAYRVSAATAMGIALETLWRTQGLVPAAVMGCGAGEYVAAVSAGCLAVEDAMRLACLHDRLQTKDTLPDEMRDADADVLKVYRETMSSIQIKPAQLPWAGASTGFVVDADSVRAYLTAQFAHRSDVRESIEHLLALGYRYFLEVSAKVAISPAIRECVSGFDVVAVGSLNHNGVAADDLAASFSRLYEAGAVIGPSAGSRLSPCDMNLPKYPFESQRHWLKPAKRSNDEIRETALGYAFERMSGMVRNLTFKTLLDAKQQPHLVQHKLFGMTVFAGASWIALLLSLGRVTLESPSLSIRHLKFIRPLTLPDDGTCEVRIELEPLPASGFKFIAYSRPIGRAAVAHCEGQLFPHTAAPETLHVDQWFLATEPEAVELSGFYDDFTARGYTLGPAFHWLHSGADGERSAIRTLKRPGMPADANSYPLHPGLIDSCFHALAGLLEGDAVLKHREVLAYGEDIVIPAEIDEIRFHGRSAMRDEYTVFASRARLDGAASPLLCGGLSLHEEPSESALLEVHGLQLKRIARTSLEKLVTSARGHQVTKQMPAWMPVAMEAFVNMAPAVIALMGDGGRVVQAADDPSPLGLALQDFPEAGAAEEALQKALHEARRDATGKRRILVIENTAVTNAPQALDGIQVSILKASQRWIRLLRMLGHASASGPILLQAVLPGALAECADTGGLVNTALAGMLKSAASEYPELSLQLVDTDDESVFPTIQVVHALRSGALVDCAEGEYLWAGGEWRLRTLIAAENEVAEPLYLEGGIALVSGGTGGLGQFLAAWLLDRGAGEVWMLGRSCVDRDVHPLFDGRVIYRCCDVTDEVSVAAIFADAANGGRKITAVVHAAGSLVDRSVEQITEDELRAVLAPKIEGAINFERYWNKKDIRLVAVTSSLVSLVASPGQAAYTAANRFLDRWTGVLRRRGMRAIVTNLGPVDGGMVARLSDAHKQRIRRQGLDLLPVASVHDAMEATLVVRGAQLAFYATAAESVQAKPQSHVGAASDKNAKDDALHRLSEELALMLGYGDAIPADMSLENVGMDSLLAVELAAWISETFAIEFPIEAVLKQTTVRGLAAAIDAARGLERVEETSEEVAV